MLNHKYKPNTRDIKKILEQINTMILQNGADYKIEMIINSGRYSIYFVSGAGIKLILDKLSAPDTLYILIGAYTLLNIQNGDM
jgi:hypothetical protein